MFNWSWIFFFVLLFRIAQTFVRRYFYVLQFFFKWQDWRFFASNKFRRNLKWINRLEFCDLNCLSMLWKRAVKNFGTELFLGIDYSVSIIVQIKLANQKREGKAWFLLNFMIVKIRCFKTGKFSIKKCMVNGWLKFWVSV